MTYHLSSPQMTAIAVLVIWEIIWKGLALWRAGRKRDRIWFVVILIVNSAGLIPIIYLLLNRDE